MILGLRFGNSAIKIVTGLRILLWITAIFGSYTLVPLWLLFWNEPEMLGLIAAGAAYPLSVFLFAIRNTQGIKHMLYSLMLIPAIGIMDSVSLWFGIRQKGFFVIDKT